MNVERINAVSKDLIQAVANSTTLQSVLLEGNISIDNVNRRINLSTTGIKTSAYYAEYITGGNYYNSVLNGEKLHFSYGQSVLDISLTGVYYNQPGKSDSAKWDNLFKNYLVIDGEFEKEINIKYDEIPNNSYFYGINNGKKIIYDYKENKILRI